MVAASGNSSSTTQSAISGGTIIIRDEEGQRVLTGKTAAETIAALNRDTSDTLNALKPIFDKEKIEAGFEIASEASRQLGQFLTNRAKEIQDAKQRSEDPRLSYAERIQAAKEYADLESKWGARGTYSQWGTIILGAASGNVMGGTGQFVQAAAVNYLQTLGAAQIKELSRELGGEGSVGHAALHAVLGCAGAAAQGASCGAGGVGALSGVVLNKLLENLEGDGGKNLSAEDQQTRVNLITSIVAGIAAAIDPNAASAAQVAARIELENNSRYMNRDKVGRLKAELTDELLRECTDASCFQEGFDRADRMASAYDVALILSHYPQLTKEKADTLAQAVLDLAPGVSNASALYELVTGRTATGEEANRFFSSLGLVPVVGGMLKKGGQALHVFADVGKAIDVGKIGGTAGAKAAIGFSEDAARAALSNIGRIDHSARHLIEAGVITANSGSKAARQAFQEIGQVILTNPEKTFDHVMAQGGQAVKGFYGKVNGVDVIIFVAKEGVGKVAVGDIVTAIKPSVQQMRNFGL